MFYKTIFWYLSKLMVSTTDCDNSTVACIVNDYGSDDRIYKNYVAGRSNFSISTSSSFIVCCGIIWMFCALAPLTLCFCRPKFLHYVSAIVNTLTGMKKYLMDHLLVFNQLHVLLKNVCVRCPFPPFGSTVCIFPESRFSNYHHVFVTSIYGIIILYDLP